jgi:PAS domain S-box-containing protein
MSSAARSLSIAAFAARGSLDQTQYGSCAYWGIARVLAGPTMNSVMAQRISESAARLSAAVPGRELRDGLPHLPAIAAGVAIAVGVVVLVGWWLGIDVLKSIVPGVLTMKVNTAIAFVLLGTGIFLRARGSRAAALPLVALIILSSVVGSQDLLGRDLGVDQWLFREAPGQIGTFAPNRMSPLTVVGFLLIGTGLLLIGRRRAGRIAPVLFLGALVIAFGGALDAVFDVTSPTLLMVHTQMALVTSAAFMVVSIGALSLLPGDGPFAGFEGPSASAKLARRLLAASVVGPTVLTWMRVAGENAGFYDANYGETLVVLGSVIFLAVVIRQTSRATQQSEAARHRLVEERDRYFDASGDMLATANADGYFIRLNPAWTELLGHDVDELKARPFVEFVHPDDREATKAQVARQLIEGRRVLNFQNRYRHRDGSYRWLEWTSTASSDGTRLYATARDVTARKEEDAHLATMVAPAREAERRRDAARRRIAATIAQRSFRPVFQPIVDLSTRRAVGFEALTRFDDGCRPDETFAAALDCGLGFELETVTLEAALDSGRLLPAGAWLSLNVSPPLASDAARLGRVLAGRSRPVVLEITEHEAIADYAPLHEAVVRLGPDVRLAVDDAGAGAANFNHLVELRPDFLKIDAGLVRGVHEDVGRQAVVAGLVHFAASAGCQVIAEGIETDAELAMVTTLGVTLGQGYLFARPAGVETWAVAEPAKRRTVVASRQPQRPSVEPAANPMVSVSRSAS